MSLSLLISLSQGHKSTKHGIIFCIHDQPDTHIVLSVDMRIIFYKVSYFNHTFSNRLRANHLCLFPWTHNAASNHTCVAVSTTSQHRPLACWASICSFWTLTRSPTCISGIFYSGIFGGRVSIWEIFGGYLACTSPRQPITRLLRDIPSGGGGGGAPLCKLTKARN